MKSVSLMLVCVALVGCPPSPASQTSTQGPPINVTEPCLPAKSTCIVSVAGVSLIRAPKFWLLDLRGRDEFDVDAMIDAAMQCDGPKGCGVAMAKPEIETLVGELAQAKVQQLPVAGGPVVAYRLERGSVVQLWNRGKELEPLLRWLLGQWSPVPFCPQCALCKPGQCPLPPSPIPPRWPDFGHILRARQGITPPIEALP